MAIQKEWLLTNGIGGFSGSTIIGMNARRYHGLLVASFNPPTDRYLVLSGISESIKLYEMSKPDLQLTGEGKKRGKGAAAKKKETVDAVYGGERMVFTDTPEEYFLHAFRTPDFQAHGEHFLEAFYYDYIPEFHYRIGNLTMTKKVCLHYGMNQVAIVYHIKSHPRKKAVLRLTPLVNFRNYHYLSSHFNMTFGTALDGRAMVITPYDKRRKIYLDCTDAKPALLNDCYFYNMDYPYEHERGLNAKEDHYIPGYYEIELMPGEEKTITMVVSVDDRIETLDGEALITEEIQRQKALLKRKGKTMGAGDDQFMDQLLLAADRFIVHRKSTDSKTIIAGYPWFTDWGRDTMIAMPGLTLATGRYEDARDILYTFARYEKDGLLPNVFPDGDGEPAYNTVDAALWYFEAVYQYLQYTGDLPFIKDQLLPVLERILQGYRKGTAFQIRMDKDSLITAGNGDTQLTWMDAKVGSWVVTPRHGKAVEINALWYNALMVMAALADQTGGYGSEYVKLAAKVKKAFVKTFWNEKERCLYDVVNEQGCDEKIRPNQILAASLSFPVLDAEQAKSVVDTVYEKLYTALGLRTLTKNDPDYRGIYEGDQYMRDGAYHQGTVWTWPLGRFITAYARVYKADPELKYQLEAFFLPFRDHLQDACIGSISEIFDGDEPLLPRGCYAQAWSVSEILRAYVEDYLPLKGTGESISGGA